MQQRLFLRETPWKLVTLVFRILILFFLFFYFIRGVGLMVFEVFFDNGFLQRIEHYVGDVPVLA